MSESEHLEGPATTVLPPRADDGRPPTPKPHRARGAQPGNANAQKHGLSTLARRLKNAGVKKNDGRSALERIKADWKSEIRVARGGDLTPQQETILEAAANTWLLLSSVDDWLLDQKSLVHRRRRELIPVIQQRSALVRTLRELLNDIGLSRVAKDVETLGEYLASRAADAGATNETQASHATPCERSASRSASEERSDA